MSTPTGPLRRYAMLERSRLYCALIMALIAPGLILVCARWDTDTLFHWPRLLSNTMLLAGAICVGWAVPRTAAWLGFGESDRPLLKSAWQRWTFYIVVSLAALIAGDVGIALVDRGALSGAVVIAGMHAAGFVAAFAWLEAVRLYQVRHQHR